ncbi:hypothetical protein TNCV_3796451 [Trichonephila clavipes]|nr:hypothetical protein TNCV_3796451 [Trichonephila clavipes]
MVLVPEDRVEIFDKLSDLDQQMQDILRNKTILESEKQTNIYKFFKICKNPSSSTRSDRRNSGKERASTRRWKQYYYKNSKLRSD